MVDREAGVPSEERVMVWSESKLDLYSDLIVVVARSDRQSREQKSGLMWALYVGARLEGYPAEVIEERVNTRILLQGQRDIAQGEELKAGPVMFYEGKQENRLKQLMEEARGFKTKDRAIPTAEVMDMIALCWEKTKFSDDRMLKHFNYSGIRMSDSEWTDVKNRVGVERETRLLPGKSWSVGGTELVVTDDRVHKVVEEIAVLMKKEDRESSEKINQLLVEISDEVTAEDLESLNRRLRKSS